MSEVTDKLFRVRTLVQGNFSATHDARASNPEEAVRKVCHNILDQPMDWPGAFTLEVVRVVEVEPKEID